MVALTRRSLCSTSVVGVQALLGLAANRVLALGTIQHPPVQEFVSLPRVDCGLSPQSELFDHNLVVIAADQGLVLALIPFAIPDEIPGVDRILQQLANP